MTFEIPDGLAPELFPLAWLVGRWRGPGYVTEPGHGERPVVQEAVFEYGGGNYLSYRATTWLLDGDFGALDGDIDVTSLEAGPVWASESGYWRVTSTESAEKSDAAPVSELEVLLTEASGYLALYYGGAQNGRIELGSDTTIRTPTATERTAATRMYGLVNAELYWAVDLATGGEPLKSHASGRLQRW